MTITPPFAAPAGIATVGWIVSVEDDETGAIETVGAATTRAVAVAVAVAEAVAEAIAVAEAVADGYIAEATA